MIKSYLFEVAKYFAKKIRGDSFSIDMEMPLDALAHLVFSRSLSIFRGVYKGVSIRSRTLVFLGKNVKLIYKKKIVFGKHVIVGDNVTINALSKEGIKLGDHVSIGPNSVLEASGSILDLGRGISIGDNCGIGGFAFIGGAGGVTIGNDVIMGQWVSFHPENHNYESVDLPIRMQGVSRKGIVVGNDCWIGVKVTILDGVNIGDGCIVAAGSVVRGIIPPYSIIAGVPAKIIKKRCL